MLIDKNRAFSILALVIFAVASVSAGGTDTKRSKRNSNVEIKVVPWGPSQTDVDTAKVRVENSIAVRSLLGSSKYRLLEFGFIDTEVKNGPSVPPTRFRAAFYDYDNDRTIVAEGDFAGREPVTAHEENFQPVPSDEEFAEAIGVLELDKKFGELIKNQTLKTFRPMPPVTVLDGTVERLVNIGLLTQGSAPSEVVSISLKNRRVIRYPEMAPPSSRAAPDACGLANAAQATSSNGTAGQYQLTVTQGANTLWDMLVVRPTASSGNSSKRSGIEVRDVKYKGKSVLKRGHVPILDVQYVGGQCGPYRDWQYQEGMFATPATGNTDPAAGIRIVAAGQTATTALENGTDTGNFKGVAVYTQNNETVLVTELEAGWYRYIMEWRFGNDGIIRPRFGFGATDNSCVCFAHVHHAYWRLDFDIVNSTNRVYQVERGRKFIKPLTTEFFNNKNPQTNRSLLIQNSTGDEAYMLVPGPNDGVVDTFGVHDMWALQYKSSGGSPIELEDGITCVTCSTAYIQIDPFVNNESILDQDVVIWYGAHFLHDDGASLVDRSNAPQILGTDHVIGPDIRPVRW